MKGSKILRDLYSKGAESLKLSGRIDLRVDRILRIPFIQFSKILVLTGVFSYLIFGSALAPVGHNQLSLAAQNEEERQQLEKQLQELETQMAEYQSTVDKYKSKGKS